MAKKGLTSAQVEHVALLANLPVSSKEITLFQAQLSEVVEYISIIANSKFKIRNSKLGQTSVMRRDETEGARTLSQDEATSGGKKIHNGFFVVPAIFEEV